MQRRKAMRKNYSENKLVHLPGREGARRDLLSRAYAFSACRPVDYKSRGAGIFRAIFARENAINRRAWTMTRAAARPPFPGSLRRHTRATFKSGAGISGFLNGRVIRARLRLGQLFFEIVSFWRFRFWVLRFLSTKVHLH